MHFNHEAVGLRRAKVVIARRTLDDMGFADGPAFKPEHIGETLHAAWFALGRLGVSLASLRERLRTDHVLRVGQGQQIAKLGRIDNDRGTKPQDAAAIQGNRSRRDDLAVSGLDRCNLRAQVNCELARADVWLQKGSDSRHGNPWLECHTRHPTIAGIEMRLPTGFAGERPIVIAQGVAQPIVAGRSTARFDMLVFVESRNALRRQLPAKPIGLLEEMNSATTPRGSERGGNAASSAADDKYIARDLTRVGKAWHLHDRHRWVAVGWHPHHVYKCIQPPLHGPSARHGARQPKGYLREGHDNGQHRNL